jgi:hypothetical protein
MKKSSFRRLAALACASVLAATAAGAASASQYQVVGAVNSWRLQSYQGATVALWYTGSACTNGQLLLPAGESIDRHKLLAATVLSAKAMGAKMTIGYDIINGTCTITDFAVDGP